MRLADLSVADVIRQLGDKTPAPGGGAVAPMVAALATALGRMVVNYSRGRKKLAEHDALHAESLELFESLGDRAETLADEDARAYQTLSTLMKLDRDDPKRQDGWSDAVTAALATPGEALDLTLTVLEQLHALCGRTNRMLDSDLAIAAILADAAARSAAWNVRINLSLIEDADRVRELEADLEGKLARASDLATSIESAARGES